MVTRITKQSPTGGAKLKRPDGSTYIELPKTPFDANKERVKLEKLMKKLVTLERRFHRCQ